MAREIGRLTARKVDTLTKPGRYADGGNLYLLISPNGGKRWTFFYRFGKSADGKPIRKEMGLGSAAKAQVSLAEARTKAADARKLLSAGIDPLEAKSARKLQERTVPSFGAFADEYLKSHRPKFRNEKHAAQWEMTLKTYCQPIRALPVSLVDTEAVLKVLQPIWSSIPETASRTRGRIENVLDAARAKGYLIGENPARWRGHLKTLLPARQRLTRGHHAALPYDDLPGFIAKLRGRKSTAALALELTILTASRTSEVLDAKWGEFDLKKAGGPHGVGLLSEPSEEDKKRFEQETKKAWDKVWVQWRSKFALLCTHYQIGQSGKTWPMELALALARQFVKGFEVDFTNDTWRRARRKRKWDSDAFAKLLTDIDRVKKEKPHVSETRAAGILVERARAGKPGYALYKPGKGVSRDKAANSLATRLYEARLHVFPFMGSVVSQRSESQRQRFLEMLKTTFPRSG